MKPVLMKPVFMAVLVVLLVLASGCSGPGVTIPSNQTPGPAQTPAPAVPAQPSPVLNQSPVPAASAAPVQPSQVMSPAVIAGGSGAVLAGLVTPPQGNLSNVTATTAPGGGTVSPNVTATPVSPVIPAGQNATSPPGTVPFLPPAQVSIPVPLPPPVSGTLSPPVVPSPPAPVVTPSAPLPQPSPGTPVLTTLVTPPLPATNVTVTVPTPTPKAT